MRSVSNIESEKWGLTRKEKIPKRGVDVDSDSRGIAAEISFFEKSTTSVAIIPTTNC